MQTSALCVQGNFHSFRTSANAFSIAKDNRTSLTEIVLSLGSELHMTVEVDIRYEPFKEIAIMEYVRFPTVDDLARFLNVAAGGKPTGVYWARGVAFFYYSLPTTSEAATKALIEEKRVYWAFVCYALMPEYRLIIETKEKIMVPVIDMTSSALFQKVAEWLRAHP